MQTFDTILSLNAPYNFNEESVRNNLEPFFRDATEIKLYSKSEDLQEIVLTFQFSKIYNFRLLFSEPITLDNSDLPTQSFDWLEFIKFIQASSCHKITLFYNRELTGLDDTGALHFFDKVNFVSVVNYPETITYLEKRGLVECKPSTCWMTTDGRAFRILGEEKNEWWEVDILGTSYGSEVCDQIVQLWGSSVEKRIT
jgi:hypothetical protein